jgi:membrane-associated phospholipid phosphatase
LADRYRCIGGKIFWQGKNSRKPQVHRKTCSQTRSLNYGGGAAGEAVFSRAVCDRASQGKIEPVAELHRAEMFSRLTGVKSALSSLAFFVTNALILPQNCVALAMANPLAGPDHEVAGWFHAHLTHTFVSVLRAFTEFGSSEWIGVVLFFLVLYFVWKKHWPSLVTLVVAVPGGMVLNEWLKVLVHRQRPFVEGPFVDWSGYSFASGHTIGATLLYGQLLLFILPALKRRHWRIFTVSSAILLVALVGFSRIALGAHFLTDVLAAIVFGIIWLALCLVAGRPMGRRSLQSPVGVSMPDSSEAVLAPVERATQPVRISKLD